MSHLVKALWDKLWFVNMGHTNKIWLNLIDTLKIQVVFFSQLIYTMIVLLPLRLQPIMIHLVVTSVSCLLQQVNGGSNRGQLRKICWQWCWTRGYSKQHHDYMLKVNIFTWQITNDLDFDSVKKWSLEFVSFLRTQDGVSRQGNKALWSIHMSCLINQFKTCTSNCFVSHSAYSIWMLYNSTVFYTNIISFYSVM